MNSCALKDTGLLLSYCQILSAFYIWIWVHYQICILQAFSLNPCFVSSISSQCHNEIGNFFLSLVVFLFIALFSNLQKCLEHARNQPCCYCSVSELCLTLYDPWTAALQASLLYTISWRLLKLMSIESIMPSSHLILCRPLLLLPSVFPSIRIFSSELALHVMWPKYWSFSISPSNEYSGLISFRMDWLDLLAVQGTLKSLLQHHSSKASILRCSDFLWPNSHKHT